ncbi:MAG: biotin-dependent carboxyltransferase [Rhizobiales bacterium]|nr:biotin-dependent carboxyltransferase [Hyphomicrobiales bacterium]
MSKLVVVSAGPATSIQDRGRFGTQRYGLPPSGAMDFLSLAVANSLVANARDSAAIEIGPLGAVFTVRDGAIRIALSGAMRPIDLAGNALPLNQSFVFAEGETLKLGPARGGVFSYLAVEGGIAGEPMFGSLSVNARSGIGSPYPRNLREGDMIVVGAASRAEHEQQIDIPEAPKGPIRVVMGPQDDEFGDARKLFFESEWVISAMSDRMGYRLEGPKIAHSNGHNIVSDGTVDGSIQVPGSGQPIVLMKDRGTTGGYPKIATVISADLGSFAQLPAGSKIRFAEISMKAAQDELRRFSAFLGSLSSRMRAAGSSNLNLEELQKANVAGAAVSAIDNST